MQSWVITVLFLFSFLPSPAQMITNYIQHFTSNPSFTSYAPVYAYWDSVNGNYYVNTFDNLANQYWAHTPAFTPVDSTDDFIFKCDFKLENIAWGCYTGIWFYNNIPLNISDPSRAFNITVAYSAYWGQQLQISDYSGNNHISSVISENTWYHLKLSFYHASHKMDLRIIDKNTGNINTNIVNASFYPGNGFKYMAVGYYNLPDYGFEWAPLRIDNVLIKSSECLEPKLFFSAIPTGFTHYTIYSMNPDGTNLTALFNDTYHRFGCKVSNDGKKIFYTRRIEAKETEGNSIWLCKSNTDGSNEQIIWTYPYSIAIGMRYRFDLSDDNQSILYASYFDGWPNIMGRDGDVFRLELSSLTSTQLTNDFDYLEDSPVFSSTGDSIAYTKNGTPWSAWPWPMHMMAADGSWDYAFLPAGIVGYDGPRWSPDGQTLVYSVMSGFGSSWEVYKITPPGSAAQLISLSTGNTNNVLESVFSPEGDKIAVSRNNRTELILADLNGQVSQSIQANGHDIFYHPLWAYVYPTALLADLLPDTTFANSFSVTLDAGSGYDSYLWNTGDTSQQITVTEGGQYYIKVRKFNCTTTDTSFVFLQNLLNSSNTTICPGEFVVLTANAVAPWAYFQDFEGLQDLSWSDTSRILFNNTHTLGPFNNQLVQLNLTNLPLHDSIEISFDLYIYDTWDGNSTVSGPDVWSLLVNNNQTLHTTFSNTGEIQSFPEDYPASHPTFAGAFDTLLPLRCWSWKSALYKIKKKVQHNSNTLSLGFEGSGLQSVCDESWSIDNVSLQLTNVGGSSPYQWSNGDTAAIITVSPVVSTTYYLNVMVNGIDCRDSVRVNVLEIEAGPNQTICNDQSLCLQAKIRNTINHVDSIAGFAYAGQLNNHLYYRSKTATNWQNAKASCEANGGHLVTINSLEENNFVFSHNASNINWIGLTDATAEGVWRWITAEPICYSNWMNGEPNNNGNEDFGHMYGTLSKWNDLNGNGPWYYFMEIEKQNHYLWSTGDTTQSISVSPAQTTTYYISAGFMNTTCMDSIVITIEDPAPVFLGNDTTLCLGQAHVLHAGNNFSTYLWSDGSTASSLSVQNNGTYWLKATSAAGCIRTDTIQLSFQVIQSDILEDTLLCQGSTASINPGSVYTNHLWSTGDVGPAILVNQPGSYWLQAKSPGGCIVADTFSVALDSLNLSISGFSNPSCAENLDGWILTSTAAGLLPYTYAWNTSPVQTSANATSLGAGTFIVSVTDALGCLKTTSQSLAAPMPVVVSLGPDTTLCEGDTIILQTQQSFAAYLWSDGSFNSTLTVSAQADYWVKGSLANGCSGYDTVHVLLKPLPVLVINPDNPVICAGESITFTAGSDIPGTTFSWSNGANGSSLQLNPTASGNISVVGIANDCMDSTMTSFTVNVLPIITINPLNPELCLGDTITLYGSSNSTPTAFVWNTGESSASIEVSPASSLDFYLVGTYNSCQDTTYISVVVKPLPNLSVVAEKNPLCLGEQTLLTVSSNIPGTTFAWFNGYTMDTIGVQAVTETYYYVTGTANACDDTAGITIYVIDKQVISLGPDAFLCEGEEVELEVAGANGQILWSDGSSAVSLNVTKAGTYWVEVDNFGCLVSDTIVFKACSALSVPNVFTPNGDGYNDTFAADTKEIASIETYIYNRWGQEILHFEGTDKKWDGTIHGQDAAAATYFYLITAKGNDGHQYTEKGSVTLFR